MRCAVESASDKMFFQRWEGGGRVPKQQKSSIFPSFLSIGTISRWRHPHFGGALCVSFDFSSSRKRNSKTADVIQLLCACSSVFRKSSKECSKKKGMLLSLEAFGCIILKRVCLFILIVYWTMRVNLLHFYTGCSRRFTHDAGVCK